MHEFKPISMIKAAVACFSALFLIFACPVLAQPTGAVGNLAFDVSKGPIIVKSNKLVASQLENMAEFSGNVKAVQGDTTVNSDILKIWYTPSSPTETDAVPGSDALDRIEADGNVTITSQGFTATADAAKYSEKDGKLVLTGDQAILESGENRISGASITLDNEGTITWEGGVVAEITQEDDKQNQKESNQVE